MTPWPTNLSDVYHEYMSTGVPQTDAISEVDVEELWNKVEESGVGQEREERPQSIGEIAKGFIDLVVGAAHSITYAKDMAIVVEESLAPAWKEDEAFMRDVAEPITETLIGDTFKPGYLSGANSLRQHIAWNPNVYPEHYGLVPDEDLTYSNDEHEREPDTPNRSYNRPSRRSTESERDKDECEVSTR